MPDYAKVLNEAQYEAVTSPPGNTLVVAGAGTGKTRAIVYRLAWLVEQGTAPESILLLTFTRKAAQEMLVRSEALLQTRLAAITGGTFHAFAFGRLRAHRPEWLQNRPFTLMDAADINQAVKECRDKLKAGKKDHSFPKTQTIASLISKARNKELPIAEVIRQDSFHLLPHANAIEDIGNAYAQLRRERALMDYDDLLFELEALLAANGQAARDIRGRYSHILVDEYQDTNRVQARIARLLAEPAQPGMAAASVMAVGDEAQSIYAFRGADVRNILDFPKLFAQARIIRLEQNYRSTQPVLNIANGILAHAPESYRKHLFSRIAGDEMPRLFRPYSDLAEAELVARRIGEMLADTRPHEIAVLFRAGYHSYALETALRKAGIAFRKYGGLKFVEAAHIKDILAFARLAINPLDFAAFSRVAAMHKGIGPKTASRLHGALVGNNPEAIQKSFSRFQELLSDLRFIEDSRQRELAPADFFEQVIDYYRPRLEELYPDDWPSRQQGLAEIPHMALAYDSLDLFVADLALEAPDSEDDAQAENCVTLSTVHSAKGLEWHSVIILDAVEDRFPSRHAQARPEDFEEERRLFYVACTRAKKRLEIYAPLAIYGGNGANSAAESPFLRELPRDLFKVERDARFARLENAAAQDRADAAPVRNIAGNSGIFPPGGAPVKDGGFCRHRIFGRGKIIQLLDDSRVQVNFPGFGIKVILKDYLMPED